MGKLLPAVLLAGTLFTSCTSMKDQEILQQLSNGNFSINHGNVSYEIDPDLGARIISAKIDGNELLLQERKGLVNWGSTFWLAPQILWNWPPPEALHEGKYRAKIDGDHMRFVSEVDNKFGVRAKKDFFYNERKKCLEIQYTVINESDSAVQFGPWEVTVVPAIGASVFFALGKSPEKTNSNLIFQNHEGIGWYSYDHEKASEWHKTFNNTAEGWLAHINADKTLFVKKFDVIPGSEIAEKQGNVEVYVNKEMKYIELENHGRFTRLEPGRTMKYKVNWFVLRLPQQISADKYSDELVRLVRGL
jgi:hypothetical protein